MGGVFWVAASFIYELAILQVVFFWIKQVLQDTSILFSSMFFILALRQSNISVSQASASDNTDGMIRRFAESLWAWCLTRPNNENDVEMTLQRRHIENTPGAEAEDAKDNTYTLINTFM